MKVLMVLTSHDQLGNTGRKPAHSIVVTEPSAPQAWFVRCVPVGTTVELEGEATLPCRGAYTWDTLRLACGHPVGLAHVTRTCARPQELLALPQLGRLQRSVLRHWLSEHPSSVSSCGKAGPSPSGG